MDFVVADVVSLVVVVGTAVELIGENDVEPGCLVEGVLFG